jgi:Chromo (CHRromatin Organisation MOdifier) domain
MEPRYYTRSAAAAAAKKSEVLPESRKRPAEKPLTATDIEVRDVFGDHFKRQKLQIVGVKKRAAEIEADDNVPEVKRQKLDIEDDQTPAVDRREKNVFDTYYDPRAPHSFGGIQGLLRQLKGLKTREQVEKWLSTQPTWSLHKRVVKRFKRNAILVHGVDEQFQADLADVSMLAKFNNGVTFWLTVIDVLSKFAWVIPMKNKTALSTIEAFDLVFSERTPLKLQTDHGKEFDNAQMREFMKLKKVLHFYTYNTEIKASIVERFNRTIKDKVWKLLTYLDTFRYIDVLQDLVHSYNNSYHRSIKMTPTQASNPENTKQVWQNLYGHLVKKPASRIKFKYKIGDYVRISETRDVFRKGYRQGWSVEVFVVDKQSPRDPVVYRLKDSKGEDVIGSFYEIELQKVPKPQSWEIEKIIKSRGREKDLEYFVKFKNYPDYRNQWVPASDTIAKPEHPDQTVGAGG